MSAMCDTEREAELLAMLAEQRRHLDAMKRDVDKVTRDLDDLKARLKRGLGQVLADGDRKP